MIRNIYTQQAGKEVHPDQGYFAEKFINQQLALKNAPFGVSINPIFMKISNKALETEDMNARKTLSIVGCLLAAVLVLTMVSPAWAGSYEDGVEAYVKFYQRTDTTFYSDPSTIRFYKAVEHFEQGAFASAVVTDKA